MTVDTSIWGSPYTEYDTMNARTGAADLDDTDFEDFPPFVKNDMSALGTNPTGGRIVNEALYIGYLNASHGFWDFNHPLDQSICYTALANPDLPLNDIGAVGTDAFAESISDSFNFLPPRRDQAWLYKQKKNDPQPICFINSYSYMHDRPTTTGTSQLTGILYNLMYSNTYPTRYLYYVGGGYDSANAGYDTNTHLNNVNINLYMSYWRDFGIRSLFGVIMVYYFDGTYDTKTGLPQNIASTPQSLHWYESQTELWRHGHPIIAAFLDVYIRSNIDGTYSNSRRVDQCFVPDTTCNLRFNDSWGTISEKHVWQPISNYYKNSLNYMPLFGHAPAGSRVTNTPNVIAQIGNQKLDGTGGVSSTSGILLGTKYVNSGFKTDTTSTAGLKSFWCELEGDIEDNLEMLRKTAAGYGLFFSDDVYDLADAGRDEDRWTDEKMCLGVIKSNGYTDGTYTKGSGNTAAPNYIWKTASQSNYDPSRPPPSPENTYNTQTVFNSIGDLATMTKRYVINASAVQQLAASLWSISSALSDGGTDFTDLTDKYIDMFLTNNPIDAIVSLQRYPMSIPKVSATTIKLGKTDTGIAAYEMEKTAYFYLFYGSTINPKFGDSFLDYEPYTKMELYIPFCGTIQLNPADIIGRTLNVQLVVDFTTGTATGFIMSDDLVIETVNGNIAIDIPVTGTQAVTVASQLNNAIANKANRTLESQSASLGNVSIGGIMRIVKDPIKMIYSYQEARNEEERAEYDLQHQNAPIHIIGSASAVGGWAIDLQCRLIIYYPSGDVIITGQPPQWNDVQLARYGRTTGFACCIEGQISSMNSGLVVGTAPDLNGMVTNVHGYAATAAELDLLRAAIAEGVII